MFLHVCADSRGSRALILVPREMWHYMNVGWSLLMVDVWIRFLSSPFGCSAGLV